MIIGASAAEAPGVTTGFRQQYTLSYQMSESVWCYGQHCMCGALPAADDRRLSVLQQANWSRSEAQTVACGGSPQGAFHDVPL
jgi:hypothetical protein